MDDEVNQMCAPDACGPWDAPPVQVSTGPAPAPPVSGADVTPALTPARADGTAPVTAAPFTGLYDDGEAASVPGPWAPAPGPWAAPPAPEAPATAAPAELRPAPALPPRPETAAERAARDAQFGREIEEERRHEQELEAAHPRPLTPEEREARLRRNPDWVGPIPEPRRDGHPGGVNEQLGDDGPYVHADAAWGDRGHGVVLEAGLLDDVHGHSQTQPGDTVDGSMHNVTLGAGHWTGRDGTTNGGVRVHAELGEIGFGSDHRGDLAEHESMSFSGPAVDAGIYGDNDGLTLAAQAQLAQVEVANLDSGAHPDRNDDGSMQFRLSEGPGAATRVHWGDRDGDGVREMGFGGDLGPVGFDVRSERIGQAYNYVWNTASNWWNH